MEIFILVILLVLIIIFHNQNNDKIKQLVNSINELKKEIAKNKVSESVRSWEKKEQPAVPQVFKAPIPAVKPLQPEPKPQPKPESVPPVHSAPKVTEEIAKKSPEKVREEVASARTSYTPPSLRSNPAPAKPTFFEKNPDLEKFIGENLINKIGIAILVLGIGFFVKYAIDQNWINEYGRVGIGVLCGGILLGFAHYLRNRFKAFSSVLVGGGIAVLYFTIAIAFHEYHLFSQTVAFSIMVVITSFSVVFSLAYNRLELAVLSLLGGFGAPFMVSTGEGNYIVLFTYLMILNVGMLALAYFKKWNLINILSYLFTILIYGGWMMTHLFGLDNPPYQGALLFGSLFYLVFFMMNIVNNIKEKRPFGMLDFSLLISNTFLYYAAGMSILDKVQDGFFQGMFTAGLAAFNFVFAFFLYKSQKADKNLFYLLVGLVLSFVSLTAPIQLQGNHITLFWSAESVLLLWLSQRSGIKLMKIASMIVMVLMIFSLFMDWSQVYFSIRTSLVKPELMMILLNKGFITGFVSIISVVLNVLLLKKEKEVEIFNGFPTAVYRNILSVVMIVFTYVVILLELNYQLFSRIENEPACHVILGFYNMIFLIGLHLFAMKKEVSYLKETLVMLGGAAIVAYMAFYNYQASLVRNNYLEGGNATLFNYLFHYLTTASVLALLFVFFKNAQKVFSGNSEFGAAVLWFVAFVVVFIASAELTHVSVMASYSRNPSVADIVQQTYKIGFPILWGICSFTMMVLGMNRKNRHLRIISLTLFFVTLLKLFIFDIRGISEGGKIAAFISLGIILLIVSFMYQKLKVLILEDDTAKQKNDIKNE